MMTKVIDRNTTIPARRAETFTTADDNQSAVDVVVLQGERERASDNRTLGRFRLEGIRPAPRGEPQVEVTYDIDANGILNVSAGDKDTGAEQRITISESTNLDKSEVERMVSDAEQNRAEDARIRLEVDARNSLDSMAYQVERKLADLGPGRTGAGDGVWFSSGFGDDDIDIDDLFGGMFSGRSRGARSRGPIAGADQEAEVTISVEEAYHGGKRSITVSGAGGERTLDVTIPAGVTDGQRIRLAGQGGQGAGGGGRGDLYLVVRLAPHPRFRVEGHDIYVDLKLAPWEAALGASVAVDTPGGEAKLRVPAGTSSGKRLRLRGRGLPERRGGPGDLFAEVRIMVPPKLTAEERRLFQELAAASTFDPRRER